MVLIGKGKHKKLTIEELKVIHEYIIMNSTTTEVAYKYFHYEKSSPWKSNKHELNHHGNYCATRVQL
jgi:hypothetical protein